MEAKKLNQINIDDIINEIKKNFPDEDTTLCQLAFEFANEAHKGQTRLSGEPYIQHSLYTALRLAEIKMGTNTVIASILHDVPEDTDKTLDDIEKEFGTDIRGLVESLTKLSNIKYRGVKRQRENLRKMFLAMAQDIRVIIIKFADRLHNLQTLDALANNKRLRIAKETLEIYVPIAGLIGMWRFKWQMEDICFKYIYPEEFEKLNNKYEIEKKLERAKFIEKIQDILGKVFEKENLKYKIEGRFKHLYSIYQKMQKKQRCFDEIHDVFALRIIVDNISDCYKVLGIIHNIWKPKTNRIKDYIAVPKPNGYQSLHTTVFGPGGKATEFQIRTQKMHEEAIYGIAAHWKYKEQGVENKEKPKWIQEILELQKEIESTHKFITDIKFDVFNDRIFVFSPKGEVFELPEDATPVDFAFAVHTDIGNYATGAIVNDKIMNLDCKLKDGDTIEIIINKNRKGPNKDWLKFIKTRKARNKIKQFAKKSRFENIKKLIYKQY